jgi:hypothetical protein
MRGGAFGAGPYSTVCSDLTVLREPARPAIGHGDLIQVNALREDLDAA